MSTRAIADKEEREAALLWPEGQRPLHEPSYIANGEPVVLSLGHYPDRLDEGVYHSWSCLCDDCLREDYALCQYYPGGALTIESWRKMYYKGRELNHE